MKGKGEFSPEQAARICQLLDRRSGLDLQGQKRCREELRALGFYISDWSSSGLTSGGFRRLVAAGSIKSVREPSPV